MENTSQFQCQSLDFVWKLLTWLKFWNGLDIFLADLVTFDKKIDFLWNFWAYLAKVVMSIPGPLIRDGSKIRTPSINSNPEYQPHEWRRVSSKSHEWGWYKGFELIRGARIAPIPNKGSRCRYIIGELIVQYAPKSWTRQFRQLRGVASKSQWQHHCIYSLWAGEWNNMTNFFTYENPQKNT